MDAQSQVSIEPQAVSQEQLIGAEQAEKKKPWDIRVLDLAGDQDLVHTSSTWSKKCSKYVMVQIWRFCILELMYMANMKHHTYLETITKLCSSEVVGFC